MAETEPLSFFVKLDGPSGPMCSVCQLQACAYSTQALHAQAWINTKTTKRKLKRVRGEMITKHAFSVGMQC